VQDYKSLCTAVMICASLVIIQAHRQTAFWPGYMITSASWAAYNVIVTSGKSWQWWWLGSMLGEWWLWHSFYEQHSKHTSCLLHTHWHSNVFLELVWLGTCCASKSGRQRLLVSVAMMLILFFSVYVF